MLRRFSFAVVLLLPLAGTTVAQTATATGSDLAWKFARGQKFQIEMQQQMEQEINMAGNPMKSSTNTSTSMQWEVKEIGDDGNAKVEATIRRILMNIDAPMVGKVTIDTQSDEEPTGMAQMISKTLKPMVGVAMTQIMNSRGEVLDVQIPAEALQGLQQSAMPAMGSPDEMIKQMSNSAGLVFPEDGISVGKKFTSTSETKTPMGAVTTTNEYTYEGETEVDNRKLHKFDVDTKVKFGGGENAMNATFDVTDQSSDGTLYFDAAAGHLDSSEVTQNMNVNISVAGQKMAQKMTQNTKVKVTELK